MLRLAARRTASQVQRYAALSSTSARGFADAPATTSDLDWDSLSSAVSSDSGKRELELLRTTYLDVTQKLSDLTQEPEAIDWAAWKKEVDPSLVDAFQQAYTSMPLPKYEDTGLAEVSKTFDDLMVQASELAAHSETRMKEIQEEIKVIDAELERMKTLTIDEMLKAEPELGKQLHAEISEGKFIP